jgi:hypothetical protein
MNEEVTLQKSDGSLMTKLFAVISSYTMIAEDAGIEITAGDKIIRTKRDGRTETYTVLHSDFKTPIEGPSIYQIKVKIIDTSD